MGDIQSTMHSISDLITDIELFDEFTDEKKLGKDLKNLAFHLRFQSSQKTLQESDIDEVMQKIIKELAQKYGAKLRLEFDKG